MADQKYSYQTLQVPNRLPATGGPSARGTAVGGAVKLLHKASKALNGWAVSFRVNRELEKLRPKIDAAIQRAQQQAPKNTASIGALVVVGIQEWEHPDATGTRAQMFLSIHVGGAGTSPQAVLQQYRDTPSMVQGAAKGWRRKNAYVWVTK